jgi:hypothetical protein
MLRFFILLIRSLIAVRWSACLKIRAGRATGLQSLALQFLSFRRGRQCPRFTIVSSHSGDCGARHRFDQLGAGMTASHRTDRLFDLTDQSDGGHVTTFKR